MCQLFTAESYRQIKLRDGRVLSYVDCGDPAGKPLLYFQAFRFKLFGELPHQIAQQLKIRLIAPDRPGFGLSDFKPGRTIKDWANDVVELADALRLERFAILGHSGGGPFAAAAAYKIPERVTRVAMVSSIGFYKLPEAIKKTIGPIPLAYNINRRLIAWTANAYLRLSGRFGYRARLLALAGGPGVAAFSAPAELVQFITGLGDEVSRPRRYDAAWELILYSRPWGFQLEDISVKVHLWHGEADAASPPAIMRYMARAIPNCWARFLPGEDHFSPIRNHMAEILSDLVS